MVGTFIRANKDVQPFSRPGYARTPITEEEYLQLLAYDDYIAATISVTQGRRLVDRPSLGSRPVVTSVQPIVVSPSLPRASRAAKPPTAKPAPSTSQWVRKGAEKRPKTPPQTIDASSRKGKEVRVAPLTSNTFALLAVPEVPEVPEDSIPITYTRPIRSISPPTRSIASPRPPTRSTASPRPPTPLPRSSLSVPSHASPIAPSHHSSSPPLSPSSHHSPAARPPPPPPTRPSPPTPSPHAPPPTSPPPRDSLPSPPPCDPPPLIPSHSPPASTPVPIPSHPSPASTPALHPSNIPSNQMESLTNCQATFTSSEDMGSSTSGRDSTEEEGDVSLSEDCDMDTSPYSRHRSDASPPPSRRTYNTRSRVRNASR
ncbi:uncharacterized protein LOC144700454 [Wolffia australiana]